MRPARRVESEASRWNPRLSSLPWMKGKGNVRSSLWRRSGGLDMGSIRAGKLRAFQGGANPLYTRRKRREMGKGVERKRFAGSKGRGKATPAKSYAEAVMSTNRKGSNAIKMKVTREEIAGNLQKLEHCLVASWKSNKKEEEDLERLGSLWANSWGLKGKLGLAKLERGRALLEFEDLREAHRVVSSGSRVMGGPT
ncbi:hypothetical protein CK203_115973 [Vitis vinifera]|uniref:DUF4283 domain-containing protein n=1 Tax=Vitis vinifera TaxID=29760 RepID=A0A438CA52_VITVI|nr:hypothetical protein CK203_115973 [Vitis vinifera]